MAYKYCKNNAIWKFPVLLIVIVNILLMIPSELSSTFIWANFISWQFIFLNITKIRLLRLEWQRQTEIWE